MLWCKGGVLFLEGSCSGLGKVEQLIHLLVDGLLPLLCQILAAEDVHAVAESQRVLVGVARHAEQVFRLGVEQACLWF